MKYKTFKVDLKDYEYNNINRYCANNHITKAAFLRNCLNEKGIIFNEKDCMVRLQETNLKDDLVKTYLYKDFNIYIFKGINPNFYESYLQKIGFGIMLYMFGCEADDLYDYIKLVEKNIGDYIDIYNDDYE